MRHSGDAVQFRKTHPPFLRSVTNHSKLLLFCDLIGLRRRSVNRFPRNVDMVVATDLLFVEVLIIDKSIGIPRFKLKIHLLEGNLKNIPFNIINIYIIILLAYLLQKFIGF